MGTSCRTFDRGMTTAELTEETIAEAMSRAGEVESAETFFGWVARVVERGLGFEARYTLSGERDASEWPHG